MDWAHEVSGGWLEARRGVVTATELQSLMSGRTKWTKAQRAGTDVVPAFAALWGQKHSKSAPDPWSYGAAARGHVMEPYAVEEYSFAKERTWHHWDDCIICNGSLGFSPDAMDVPQRSTAAKALVHDGKLWYEEPGGERTVMTDPMPESILEIKCYGVENHMKNMVAKKESLKERYQIAAAMMVLPSLKEGVLVQYNPDVDFGLFDRVYAREDLEKEIEELSEVLDMWGKTCRWFEGRTPDMQPRRTEQEIYGEYSEAVLADIRRDALMF